MAVSKLNLTFIDRFNKSAGVGFFGTAITSGNIVAQQALLDALQDAVEAVSLLTTQKVQIILSEEKTGLPAPSGDADVVGNRWLVRMIDVNGNAVTRQIPGANLALAGAGGFMDLTAGAGLALKGAIEDYALSNDGEAVTVTEVIYLNK